MEGMGDEIESNSVMPEQDTTVERSINITEIGIEQVIRVQK